MPDYAAPMQQPQITYETPFRGIGLKVLSIAIFMGMATCIKAASNEVPPGQAVFFRSFFAIPIILVWLHLRHDSIRSLSTRNPMGHLWRGLIGTSAMALSFTSLGLLPLPEVTAIGYAAPLLTVVLAAMFLGEQVGIIRITTVLMGLVGVMIVLAPRLSVISDDAASSLETVGAIAMFTAALLMATAQVFTRKLVTTETTAAIVFYFSAVASLLALFTIPFGWVMPSGQALALLVTSGFLGGVAQIILTTSYRHAPASVLAPFEYTSMLLAMLVGYFIFSEVPTSNMLAGASVVILAGLVIIFRERQLGLRRGRARAVMSSHQG